MFKDDEGKTEKPTPERRNKARNKGQTCISKEFTMAGTLLIAVLALEYLGGWLVDGLQACVRYGMNVNLSEHILDGDGKLNFLAEGWTFFKLVAAPYAVLILIVVAATMLSGYCQIGFKIAREAMKFKPEKLNPVTNIKQVIQLESLAKVAFSLFKLVVLGSVLYFVLAGEWRNIGDMHEHTQFSESVAYIMSLALRVFFWVAFIVLVMAIVDIAWQRYRHTKSLMMSKQEVEDERKRADGDPMIKGRLRNARMALMKQRMMDAVPEADVVITNPTHFSVALKYDREKDHAPVVVAKGLDEVALKIRELAKENEVPLMEDPPLARALYRAVEIGSAIPERFFSAVATILGHVYRLKERVA